MAINKTTTETKNKIKANSVIALPNRPQIPAEQLKQAFVKPIVDTSNSMIQELDRIVEETNAELEQVQVDITEAIDEHNTDTETTHLDIRQEITDLENDLQEQIDVIDGTLQNIEGALENKADLVDGKVPLEQLPSFEEIPSLELTKAKVEAVLTGDITSHNHATEIGNHNTSETAHTSIRNAVAEAKAIAEGKSRARVFATKSALDTWLLDSENVASLQIGDNFYIEETDKPDYWWNGTTIIELETQKVDLTEYAKKTELLTLGTTENDAYRGDLGQIAYNHSQSDHAPSNAQKNSDITKAEIEAKLTGEISSHSHALPTHNHDDRYYTETEVDTKLGGKADTTHNHTKSQITDFPTSMTPTAHNHTKSEITDFPTSMPPTAHNHDSDYYKKSETYTKAQIDALVGDLAGETQELKSITTEPTGSFVYGDKYYNSSTKGLYYYTGSAWELTGLGSPIEGVIYSFNGTLYFWNDTVADLIQIGGGVDLSNYYSKTEIDAMFDNLLGGEY